MYDYEAGRHNMVVNFLEYRDWYPPVSKPKTRRGGRDGKVDKKCQDAVEGRARFARPNIQRPSKAIGEYSE
jgi:hypothetical protein